MQNLKTKEEKEVLEHFTSIFSMMNPLTFQEVFSSCIEYLVERVHKVKWFKLLETVTGQTGFAELGIANHPQHFTSQSIHQSHICHDTGGVLVGTHGGNGHQHRTKQFVPETF